MKTGCHASSLIGSVGRQRKVAAAGPNGSPDKGRRNIPYGTGTAPQYDRGERIAGFGATI